MHQHLKDSIRFCYKQEETTYEELFCETVKAEKEKVSEIKITSLKTKLAITEPAATREDSVGIQDLRQKINALTTAVKSSTFGEARSKQPGNGGIPHKGKDNSKMNGSPYKGRGPATTSVGPFEPGQKHFQCYRYGGGGWGHSYKQCPSQGGIHWRALNGAEAPQSPGKGPNGEKKQ